MTEVFCKNCKWRSRWYVSSYYGGPTCCPKNGTLEKCPINGPYFPSYVCWRKNENLDCSLYVEYIPWHKRLFGLFGRKKKLPLNQLCADYIVASSPNYIWSRFSRSPDVIQFSEKNTLEFFEEEFLAQPDHNTGTGTVEEIVYSYALIVSSLLKSKKIPEGIKKSSNYEYLQWTDYFEKKERIS